MLGQMRDCASANTPSRVQACFHDLDDALMTARAAVLTLRERLSPVLSPAPPAPCNPIGVAGPKTPPVTVCGQIADATTRVHEMGGFIQQINEELDV